MSNIRKLEIELWESADLLFEERGIYLAEQREED